VPDLMDLPSGCRFLPRCPLAIERCHAMVPMHTMDGGCTVRCVRPGEAA
jgi:oligopeptide/dipeptide ABC transporter ATP-binding protein